MIEMHVVILRECSYLGPIEVGALMRSENTMSVHEDIAMRTRDRMAKRHAKNEQCLADLLQDEVNQTENGAAISVSLFLERLNDEDDAMVGDEQKDHPG